MRIMTGINFIDDPIPIKEKAQVIRDFIKKRKDNDFYNYKIGGAYNELNGVLKENGLRLSKAYYYELIKMCFGVSKRNKKSKVSYSVFNNVYEAIRVIIMREIYNTICVKISRKQ